MKKYLLFLMLLFILTGCSFNGGSILSSCKKNITENPQTKVETPTFPDEQKLSYTYIIDGIKYQDRLLTNKEKNAFDFLKLFELLGIENKTENNKITLSYFGEEMSLVLGNNEKYSIIYKGKPLNFDIYPYKKDGTIYVNETEIINLYNSKKLPLNAVINEDEKTIKVNNPLFNTDSDEFVNYFDVIDYKNDNLILSVEDKTMVLTEKNSGTKYRKDVYTNYIDGKIVLSTEPNVDIYVHLWDGNKVRSIPLKLGE